MRTTMDFSPYRRSLIGFDSVFDLMENAARVEHLDSFPPYDIEQNGDDAYRIRFAVAGYTPAEIDVTAHQNVLVVTGRNHEKADERNYLYRGIAAGGFERRFELADHVAVSGANLVDGVLEIDLKREVPEAAKPKKIAIGQPTEPRRIGKMSSTQAA